MAINDVPIQEDDGARRLILRGRANLPVNGQMIEKSFYFQITHRVRMPAWPGFLSLNKINCLTQ